MHGIVVQAIKGQRQHYQPLQSKLTTSHQFIDVVSGILQVYPFERIYIADLNAILRDQAHPHHRACLAQAIQHFPQIEWWVDAGITQASELEAWQALGVKVILASESLTSLAQYQALLNQATNSLLSLDYFLEGFRGPAALEQSSALWTDPTILMSLPQVGAQQGPDLQLLQSKRAQSPQHTFIAAGGVRHMADIRALQQHGANGVLIASALHLGHLTTNDIQSV